MNYIELINNFWDFAEENDIKSNEISVYFALLKYNNSLNWIPSFRCDYAVICQYASVSKNTFYSSVNKLSEFGLIKYEKGKRNVLKPKISILKIKNRKGIIKEQSEEQHEEQNEEQKGNLYKLLNNKTIKLLNINYKSVNKNLESWILNSKNEIKILNEIKIRDNVFLKKEEKEKLISEYGEKDFEWIINKLSNYKLASGKKYKSDYGAINSWVIKELLKFKSEPDTNLTAEQKLNKALGLC